MAYTVYIIHLPNSKTYQQPKSASNTFYFFFIADKVFDDMSIIHQARARKKERVDLKNVQVCLCVCVCERDECFRQASDIKTSPIS